ncbi:hypothetical protein K1720_08875 [Thermococcus argininiproducens]|uniref:Uncharacterized protein n=1 Tax=Thermococcus argininiproducens TaxID=2866384 RepID=A0A9E7M925_9EURY|nr:hypothetical protein [Thermococcus argininiproducens]USG99610.1 hypothetical protein K1720_08875 [Thermococcus argininiproducens]
MMFGLSKNSKIQKQVLAVALLEIFIGLSHLTYACYEKLTWQYNEFLYDWDDVGGDDGVFWTFWGLLTLLLSFAEVSKIKIVASFVLLIPAFWGVIVTLSLFDALFGNFDFAIFTLFALLYEILFFASLVALLSLWKSS